MATYGDSSAPSYNTQYFDALFTLSVENYQKELIDNIGASNPFLHKMLKGDFYEGVDGGEFASVPLMYALAEADSYEGFDELSTTPTDGITKAIFDWRQISAPISYSMKEVIQNRGGIKDLAKTKIMQCEMGLQEYWAASFFQGNGNAALATPKTSTRNGSYGPEPIGKLIHDDPTGALTVGNIPQATYSWWQNQYGDSSATTMSGLLQEFDHKYNQCALGVGGPPDLIVVDPTTYELLVQAIYMKYRQTGENNEFPFENVRFKKAMVVMEDKVPDSYSNLTSTATYGTAYFLNTKFFRVKYINGRNFVLLTDEAGKAFQKPIGGDSRVANMAWMGQVVCANRRKQGVLAKIARTLTAS
jgi:hypothetical protein